VANVRDRNRLKFSRSSGFMPGLPSVRCLLWKWSSNRLLTLCQRPCGRGGRVVPQSCPMASAQL